MRLFFIPGTAVRTAQDGHGVLEGFKGGAFRERRDDEVADPVQNGLIGGQISEFDLPAAGLICQQQPVFRLQFLTQDLMEKDRVLRVPDDRGHIRRGGYVTPGKERSARNHDHIFRHIVQH